MNVQEMLKDFKAALGNTSPDQIREMVAKAALWQVGQDHYILIHEGVKYIRMTRSTEHIKFRVTKYYVDGKEVRLKTFVKYLTPSAAAEHLSPEFPIVFNVKMKNIIDITDK